ncbi:hypothetical protein TrVE_jg877 [Triparma verrucosa]|uniref:Uncharacterized protein n=1 Tax=Triparma verrucosa TaxID=1606542 RepID=A0A9W7BSR6_9STRA|nr:hypothetical protein TrVE_jg877 [Triparma verrucosa]
MPPKSSSTRYPPTTQLQDLSSKNRLLARDLNSTRSKSKHLQKDNSMLSSRVLKLEGVVRGLTQQTAELQRLLRESREEGKIWKEELRGQEAAIRDLSDALAKAYQNSAPPSNHHQFLAPPQNPNPNNVTSTSASVSDSFLSLSNLSIDAAPFAPYSPLSSPVSPPPGLGEGNLPSPTAALRRAHRLQAQERASSTSPPLVPSPSLPQLPIGTPPFAPPSASNKSSGGLEHSPPLQFSPLQQQQKRLCRRRSVSRPTSYVEPSSGAKLRQGHVFFPLDDISNGNDKKNNNRLDFSGDNEDNDAPSEWQTVPHTNRKSSRK